MLPSRYGIFQKTRHKQREA